MHFHRYRIRWLYTFTKSFHSAEYRQLNIENPIFTFNGFVNIIYLYGNNIILQ